MAVIDSPRRSATGAGPGEEGERERGRAIQEGRERVDEANAIGDPRKDRRHDRAGPAGGFLAERRFRAVRQERRQT
jgi:hypothetical protein